MPPKKATAGSKATAARKITNNASISLIVKNISAGIKDACAENEDYFLAKPVTINLIGKEGGIEFQAKVELSFKWALKDVPVKKPPPYKPLQPGRPYVQKKSFTPKPGWEGSSPREGKRTYTRYPARRVYKPRPQTAYTNEER